jgi:Mlc titration factor MtfA (ptsG expression regulator)
MPFLLLSGVAAFIGVFYLAFRRVMKPVLSETVRRIRARPIPAHWLPLILDRVPAVRGLSAEQHDRLLRSMRSLLANRSWEGCGGLELTEEMQLVIAAQACLLVLHHPGEPYPAVREILVYPRTYVPWRTDNEMQWLSTNALPGIPHRGESWSHGIVVLAWDSALDGARDPQDGANLVFHEFAHALAFERHLTVEDPGFGFYRGTQKLDRPRVSDPDAWHEVLEGSFDELCWKLSAGIPTVLDPYASTKLSEFFAVATEVFFERPRELRAEYPLLFEQLLDLYGMDPASLLPPSPAENAA